MSLVIVANTFVGDAAFDGFDQVTPIRKQREWLTDVVRYDTAVQQRNQIMPRPIRHWFLNWALLDTAAQAKLRELFDAARGGYDTFLWLDDDEYLASAVSIATDGATASFQLKESYYAGEDYSWDEDKADIVPGSIYAPVVTHSVDGAQTEVQINPPVDANTFYLDDTTGIMTWPAAHKPSAGTLTCTFEYYFRVQFVDDMLEQIQIHAGPLYQAPEIELLEVI